MENDILPTVLEERLGAHRLFLSMLLAHLEDNGLVDRGALESEFWATLGQSIQAKHAHQDMLEVFEMATMHVDRWSLRRGAEQ